MLDLTNTFTGYPVKITNFLESVPEVSIEAVVLLDDALLTIVDRGGRTLQGNFEGSMYSFCLSVFL